MKVLVCGGRDFNELGWVYDELDKLHADREVSLVINGSARGADSLAQEWAQERQVPYLSVPAKWDKYGKSAGYKRNAEMLTFEPDYVLAFPGGKGTKMMCELARKEGVFVKELADVAK